MILTPATLPDVTRSTSFSSSIKITPEEGETVNSVSITPSVIDSHVTVTLDVVKEMDADSTVTWSGMYVSGFHDNAKYVNKGSSDLIETPTTVNSLDAIPPNKDLFQFNQDGVASIAVSYVIEVKYDSQTIDTETVTQTIRNSTSLGYNILNNYYRS